MNEVNNGTRADSSKTTAANDLTSVSAAELKAILKRRAQKKKTAEQSVSMAQNSGSPVALDPAIGHPLSHNQEQLWLQCQMAPDDNVWNVPCRLELTGAVDVPVLRQAIEAVMRKHSSLCTRFHECDNAPVQQVQSEVTVPLQVIDVSERAVGSDRDAAALEVIAEQENIIFDVTKAPLFQATLVTIEAQKSILGLVFHHIIVDDWSIGLFIKDLQRAYGRLHAGQSVGFEAAPHAAEFAYWQQDKFSEADFSHRLQYWRMMLEDASQTPDVADFPRPTVSMHTAGNCQHSLDAQLSDSIRGAAQAMGVSPFALMLSAYSTVLMRFYDCDSITIGSPFANRVAPNSEQMLGFFVNSLPLQISQAGYRNWAGFVQATHQKLLGALGNSDVPFSKIVEAINPPRDRNRHLLFQHVIAMQDTLVESFPMVETEPDGLRATPQVVGLEKSLLDLRLYVWRTPSGYDLTLNFAAELFENQTCAQILQALETVLRQVVVAPDLALSHIGLRSTGADCALAAVAVDEASVGDNLDDICARFADVVAAAPDAIILRDDQGELSANDLQTQAQHLAHILRSKCVPGASVGICLPRGRSYVRAVLACLHAGIPFVPLDPSYPNERLHSIAHRAKVGICFVESDGFEGAKTDFECLQEQDCFETDLAPSFEASYEPIDLDQTAYILFTSGTTGTPKGVEISRRSWSSYLTAFAKRHDITLQDRILQRAPISFDASLWELGMLFWAGASMRVVSDEHAKDPRALLAHCQDWRVSQLRVTPALLSLLVDESGSGPISLSHLQDLRRLICGADRFSTQLYANTRQFLPSCEIVNAYGPTETTINCVTAVVDRAPQAASVPIGLPTANNKAVVVDQYLQPVPPGFSGELLVAGSGLARGYLGNQLATDQAFVHLPWAGGTKRFYRTGDLVRLNGQGDLVFIGRRDDQVKLRGHRIELAEIEQALLTHHAVKDVAVQVLEQSLYCWLELASAAPVNQADLTMHLERRLPSYMIPSQWRSVPAVPRQKSGKTLRNHLVQDLGQPLELQSEIKPHDKISPRAATSTLERTILDAVSEILSVPVDDVMVTFFDLGVTSLQLVGLRRQLEKHTQRSIALTAFFEHRTPQKLARFLDVQPTEQSTEQPKDLNDAGTQLIQRRNQKRRNQKRQSRMKNLDRK